jgi:hypothetical protein
MEPLWSPVFATGGNRWQIGSALNPPKQAKSLAMGCDRLPEKFHGKQGVCRGLHPLREVPSLRRRRSTSLKRQVLRTRRPTGLDRATLTGERGLVKTYRRHRGPKVEVGPHQSDERCSRTRSTSTRRTR